VRAASIPPFKLKRVGGLDLLCHEIEVEGERTGAQMIVSGRRGGVSFDRGDLNLSYGTGDDTEAVKENRLLLARALANLTVAPKSDKIACLRQRHTSDVLRLDENNAERFFRCELEGDGMVTGLPGIWLSISIGDCLPVLIFDSVRRVLAMVHAGWSGTAERVVKAAVSRMVSDFACSAKDMVAVLGPCIRRGLYEVDGPVFRAFEKNWSRRDLDSCVADKNGGRGYLDLATANRLLLQRCGLAPGRIRDFGMCTGSLSALFFSHRRDGLPSGRMLALATFI